MRSKPTRKGGALKHRFSRSTSPRNASQFTDAATAFAALGDETRLAIIARLCGAGPLSLARLSDGADMTRQAVSKHLETLERAGLLRSTRRGRERIWELESSRLEEISDALDRVSRQWDTALEQLRKLVEDPS